MHRDRSKQPGPTVVSQAVPSAAAPVHVPGVVPLAPAQTPLVLQGLFWSFTSPQG
ncbi:MAG: hypothetical protein ABSF69_21550 [Polyangiaceae bacterium]